MPRGIGHSPRIVRFGDLPVKQGGNAAGGVILIWDTSEGAVQAVESWDEHRCCWVFQFNQALPAGTKFVVETL